MKESRLVKKIVNELGYWGFSNKFATMYVANEDNNNLISPKKRKKAFKKLPEIIQKYHDAGEPIDLANNNLMNTLIRTIKEDSMQAYPTQAAEDIVHLHVMAYEKDKIEKFNFYKKANRLVKGRYLRDAKVPITKIQYEIRKNMEETKEYLDNIFEDE